MNKFVVRTAACCLAGALLVGNTGIHAQAAGKASSFGAGMSVKLTQAYAVKSDEIDKEIEKTLEDATVAPENTESTAVTFGAKLSAGAAADILKEKGAIVETFDLGLVDYAIPAYYVIASAEASSNLSRFDGVKYGYRTKEYEGLHNMYKKSRSEGFGPEVKRRIMLGSFVLSSGYYDAYYLKALRTKALIKQAFDKAFEKYDVILGPAAPTTAPKLGQSLSDPIKMYLGDIYTISVNLAGLPGISLPCGKDKNGLPIGLQLIGNCFEEKKIIRAAYAFEQTRTYEHSPLA